MHGESLLSYRCIVVNNNIAIIIINLLIGGTSQRATIPIEITYVVACR